MSAGGINERGEDCCDHSAIYKCGCSCHSRRLKAGEVVGREVRLLRDLRTNDGDLFPVGSTMRVHGTWRGRFHLDAERNPDGSHRGVRMVRRESFEVLP